MKLHKQNLERIIMEEFEATVAQQNEDLVAGLKGGIEKIKKSEPAWRFFTVLKALSSGVTDTLKEEIAESLLQHLEIDPTTPLAKIFINFIGNTTLDDLARVVTGSDKCEAVTSELGDALAETIIEEIPAVLGLAPNSRITKVVRESLSKTLTAQLSEQIAIALCDIDYSSVIEELPGGKLLKKLFFED